MRPAEAPLATHLRLNPAQQKLLEKLKLLTVRDLLFYFPHRYGKELPVRTVAELQAGSEATVYGQVVASKTSKAWHRKIPLGELTLADQTGKIKAVWFHQAFLAKKIPVGQPARLSGKVTARQGELYFANPEIEVTTKPEGETLFHPLDPTWADVPLAPIYPETRGLSSLWFRHQIKKLLTPEILASLEDPLPAALLQKYHLPTLTTAIIWIHAPQKNSDAMAARKRFAFEEVFLIQLVRLKAKEDYQAHGAYQITVSQPDQAKFIGRLGFPLTEAQRRSIEQINHDLEQVVPMTRLLEGDVGSGKTAVAASTALAVVLAGYEVAYMAPTEILARQHFESFIKYFAPNQIGQTISVGLLTGSECRKFPSKINPTDSTTISRPQLLKWVANGEIPILIGTHSLIQKTVKWKNLAYVIIDEQHRFGVMQRAKLARQNKIRAPHLLSMTATPIPRTLALTIYGDLDLSLLDELPPGRKPIVTKIVSESERPAAYEHIRRELEAGRQAYVICPRIDEPDPNKELALNTKSAKAEQKRLAKKIFPDYEVGLVHSQMLPAEKTRVMNDFASGQIAILVATSVVEVGVNVPNATIILIEGAERFGLAQLHQLRGRVLRSSHQAHCYLFTSGRDGKNIARLRALEKAKNGFELAELDLGLRGAGTLNGGKQWGISDLGMEAIRNLKMVEAARLEARRWLETDPDLKNHPCLASRLKHAQTNEIHFE